MRRLTISVPPCATSRAIYASNTGALSLRADSRGFAAQCSAQQARPRVHVPRECSSERRAVLPRRLASAKNGYAAQDPS